MNIDTVHRFTETEVKIIMCCDQERRLSDEDWKRIAFNQHLLLWKDDASGTAVLPRRLTGVLPQDDVRVKRDGDHISVFFPLQF